MEVFTFDYKHVSAKNLSQMISGHPIWQKMNLLFWRVLTILQIHANSRLRWPFQTFPMDFSPTKTLICKNVIHRKRMRAQVAVRRHVLDYLPLPPWLWNPAAGRLVFPPAKDNILLMEEILHQLRCSLCHYLQGFIRQSRDGARFLPSTVWYTR